MALQRSDQHCQYAVLAMAYYGGRLIVWPAEVSTLFQCRIARVRSFALGTELERIHALVDQSLVGVSGSLLAPPMPHPNFPASSTRPYLQAPSSSHQRLLPGIT